MSQKYVRAPFGQAGLASRVLYIHNGTFFAHAFSLGPFRRDTSLGFKPRPEPGVEICRKNPLAVVIGEIIEVVIDIEATLYR